LSVWEKIPNLNFVLDSETGEVPNMKEPDKAPQDFEQVIITPREKEVMHLLAKGLSSRKIAEALGISFHTVESYRKHLLQKFNSKTTVEMVLKA
jgi:DNA-binding CsgD family transcriptional regulator